MSLQPPKWADKILEWYCHADLLEDLQGDLHELYRKRAESHPRTANWLFTWWVLRSLRWSVIKKGQIKHSNQLDMYRNYLKIALRSLQRSRLYSVINITGLAVGLAVFMLIFLYVKDEVSYDNYHEKPENIYRVVSDLTVPDNFFQFALTPPQLKNRLVQDFPEIQSACRLAFMGSGFEYINDKWTDVRVLQVDQGFFDIFNIPLVIGDSETILKDPFAVVLTERTARQKFGDISPIGKTLTFDGIDQPFEIKGIIQDPPSNTHFSFDMLVSMETRVALGTIAGEQWFYLDYFTYLRFPDGHDIEAFAAGMPDFIERHIGEAQKSIGQTYEFYFQPVRDIHLKSDYEIDLGTNGNIDYVYIFSIIAAFILIIACVNFMNLSTARASKRAKEIGLRKVVGAVRKQLIAQFLVESCIISVLAFIIGVGLISLVLPTFSELVDKNLSIMSLFSQELLLYWVGLILITGFVAGFYPAIVLSEFSPIKALRSSSITSSRATSLRRSLVVLQMVISTVLIIGTIIVNKQLSFFQGQNLGFNQDEIVVMNFGFDGEVQSKYQRLTSELARHSEVAGISFSRTAPNTLPGNWYVTFEDKDGAEQNTSMHGYLVDYEFVDLYGLELIAGRNFDVEIQSDSSTAFLVNEAAVAQMGFESNEAALNKSISQFGKDGKIIGVLKDFNFKTLHNEIEPLAVHIANQRNLSMLSIKLAKGSGLNELKKLGETWDSIVTDLPFEINFIRDELNARYQAEIRTSNVIGYFSVIAIFIASLGLFALATLAAEQQRRDLSVKMVLGASTERIAYGFSFQFMKLTLVAFLIGAPIAFFLSEKWLENFTYRTQVEFTTLLIGGLISLVITLVAIIYQSVRITNLNPAENLRSE